jgi:cysteine-rich repeat protein
MSSPCIDMTGRWRSAGSIAGSGDYEMSTDITQRGTDLILRVPINGVARMAGTVDPVTGAFDVRLARTDTCEAGFDTLIGSATSLTYTAAGSVRRPRPSQPSVCDTHVWSETGMRCGSGTVDAGEACDDGNLNDGDGCSATCGVEACWRCTDTPSACVRAPRAPCKGSTAPAQSTLSIRNVSDHYRDTLVWRWKKGEDTNLAELGDPVGTDDYVLCVFDESSPTPALLFSALMPAAPLCDGSSCWAATGSSGFAYRNKSAVPEGVIKTRIRSGTGGAAKAQVKGKGIHMSDRAFPLPPLPLALPLRVQLQGAGGFCAETRHDASGVLSNDPGSGLFRARGAP